MEKGGNLSLNVPVPLRIRKTEILEVTLVWSFDYMYIS